MIKIDSDLNIQFSRRLRTIRGELGLSPTKMADAIGVARTTYNLYENANAIPSVEKMCQIADVLGVSLDYLLGRAETNIHTITTERDIADIILRINEFNSVEIEAINTNDASIKIKSYNLSKFLYLRTLLKKCLAYRIPEYPNQPITMQRCGCSHEEFAYLKNEVIRLALEELSTKPTEKQN